MIRYDYVGRNVWAVILEGKTVGEIRQVEGGYQYFPKGQRKGGEIFATLAECKISLEES